MDFRKLLDEHLPKIKWLGSSLMGEDWPRG